MSVIRLSAIVTLGYTDRQTHFGFWAITFAEARARPGVRGIIRRTSMGRGLYYDVLSVDGSQTWKIPTTFKSSGDSSPFLLVS